MEEKIQKLLSRLVEVESLLSSADAFLDKKSFKELTLEHSRLNGLKDEYEYYKKTLSQLSQNKQLIIAEKDPEMISVIREDIANLEKELELSNKRLHMILVPPDPRDNRNIIMEIRAGTGGDEAALFVGDLIRMYQYFAEHNGWKVEYLSTTPSERGGFKEFIMSISGTNVFRLMQFEGGTHRVQRVPDTEASGRLHTSAATVAILLEPSEEEEIDLNEKDLKIDTYRASGAGGQHVNTTDSAVRITHIPTGAVVCCQDERSQHKNKEKAMRHLKAKILEKQREDEAKSRAEIRSVQVGSGDRSERIRTYNFPQNRLTDHRINFTVYNLDQVMEGNLEEIVQALVSHFYQEKLQSHE
ncbi:MAG: peptide chain release factor 1 [Chlamydiae bacterium RIFCSPHIGHO2_12_FULL_27_8]|nr:MAG: peptide chain release factor 1 [Chlamydiae bacterium RIFCSPHIGHO2_12_FULL_27_8]